jgi:hypothetical protein
LAIGIRRGDDDEESGAAGLWLYGYDGERLDALIATDADEPGFQSAVHGFAVLLGAGALRCVAFAGLLSLDEVRWDAIFWTDFCAERLELMLFAVMVWFHNFVAL